MRVLSCLVALAAMTGCGEVEGGPAPEPTGFSIRKVDLYLDEPADICRRKNSEFLSDLTSRIQAALPPDIRPSFEFHDFNVPDNKEDAVFRFFLNVSGDERAMHFASGRFDPTTCSLSKIEIGKGTHPLSADSEVRIPVS